jgi:hypothetical protein
MSTKRTIVIGFAAGVLSAALVFDGVSHSRNVNSGQAISQNQATTPPAAAPANPANANIEVQTAVVSDAITPAVDAEQNIAADAVSQGQTDGNAPTEDADGAAGADASQPIVVPAGTTLTIRLGERLGSRISEMGQSFSGTLDQDVVVDGQTVVPAGASVSGKVVFARPAGPLEGEANLQLKLTSVNVNNADLAVMTSIRSFGSPIKGKNKVGKVLKGLAKRAEGEEREVVLGNQSAFSFTLRQPLEIQ